MSGYCTNGCKSLCGCRELNSESPEEHSVLLSTSLTVVFGFTIGPWARPTAEDNTHITLKHKFKEFLEI